MVANTDEGYKIMCPHCKGPIKHLEPGGVVGHGRDKYHTDCYREKMRRFEAAIDGKVVRDAVIDQRLNEKTAQTMKRQLMATPPWERPVKLKEYQQWMTPRQVA